MSSIDRVLIDPDDAALGAAVRAAVAAVDRDMDGQGHALPFDADAWKQLTARMRQEPEGVCEWRIPGPGPNGVRAALVAVWWSDALGRRHLRLLGGCRHRGMELPLPIPSPHRPALACVYPEACVVASQHRRPRLLAVCECGAWGRPERLAWMGATCGPCFDRAEHERPPSSSLPTNGETVLAFTADGRLAVWDRDGLRLWDLSAAPAWVEKGWQAVHPCKLECSPDGGYLATLNGTEEDLVVFPINADVYVRFAPVRAFAFLREPGQFVAQFTDSSLLVRCSPRYDEPDFRGEPGQYDVAYSPFRVPYPIECHDLAVSPDGRTLAAACGERGLCFWDAYSGEPLYRAEERQCVGPLLWSPDGTALACGVAGRFWKAVLFDFYQRKRRAALGGTERLNALAFTPDGRWLFTCEQTSIRAWDVATGVERNSVTPGIDEALAVAVSPDARTVALAMRGRVRLWPTELLLPEG